MGDYHDVWVCMPHGAGDYEADQTKFSMCPYCEIAKLGAEVERLKQTLSAVITYTELSEQDIEQAKFEARVD